MVFKLYVSVHLVEVLRLNSGNQLKEYEDSFETKVVIYVQSCIYDGFSIKNRRSLNMDSLLLKESEIEGKAVYLMVVCDGVGSLVDGAFASSMSVKLLSDWLDEMTDTRCIGLNLQKRILEINQIILEQARRYSIQTATTLSALLIVEDRYYIAHMGDSRIYGYSDGTLKQLTYDHVLDGKLTSCIGRTEAPDIFYNEGSAKGTRFLLCSDGLYKKMDVMYLQHELEHVRKKTIKKTIERLLQYVIERGESDNISITIMMHER